MEKTIPFFKDAIEDVSRPPHVVPQFVDMILGEQQLSPTHQQQAWDHLAVCIQCQTFLECYLHEVIAYNKEHSEPDERVRKLLTKLAQIIHETLKEDIPAYVETVEKQGAATAARRFPQFAEHLPTCQICQLTVQNIHEWLHYCER